MGENKFDVEIAKKEKLIVESKKKIKEYNERIRGLKESIKFLNQKKKAAFAEKFLAMCEKGQVDLVDESLEKLFSSAGIKTYGSAEEKEDKEKADTAPEDGTENISFQ